MARGLTHGSPGKRGARPRPGLRAGTAAGRAQLHTRHLGPGGRLPAPALPTEAGPRPARRPLWNSRGPTRKSACRRILVNQHRAWRVVPTAHPAEPGGAQPCWGEPALGILGEREGRFSGPREIWGLRGEGPGEPRSVSRPGPQRNAPSPSGSLFCVRLWTRVLFTRPGSADGGPGPWPLVCPCPDSHGSVAALPSSSRHDERG